MAGLIATLIFFFLFIVFLSPFIDSARSNNKKTHVNNTGIPAPSIPRNKYRFYEAYMKSSKWRWKAKARRKLDKYMCQACGARNTKLDVHHVSYARLGNENMSDLITVCRECHSTKIHGRSF